MEGWNNGRKQINSQQMFQQINRNSTWHQKCFILIKVWATPEISLQECGALLVTERRRRTRVAEFLDFQISRFLSQRRARGSKVWSWRHIYCLQLAYEHPIVVATVFEVWSFAKVVVGDTIHCNFGIEIEFPNIMQNNLIVLQKELSKLLVGHLWLCQHDSLLTLCTYMDLVETDIILKSQIQLKSLNIWWESITWLRVFARRLIWGLWEGRGRQCNVIPIVCGFVLVR